MRNLFLILLLAFSSIVKSQSIQSESINFQVAKLPEVSVAESSRTFNVTVTSPYSLTTEQVIHQSKIDHQEDLDNYDNTVEESERAYQVALNNYAEDEKKAKEKFEAEEAAFKKLSLLERMALIDQKKNPKLTLPTRPVYHKPAPPVYREPNLNQFIIVDNNVLASKINVQGFKKTTKSYLDISVNIEAVNFQDNAGQSYANQPTTIVVKENGEEKVNETFFQEFKFIASSPTNSINKTSQEKIHLDKVIAFVNTFLNNRYGYGAIGKTVKIESVKNSKNKYDDLEKAHIYITTNLKKLQPEENSKINEVAFEGIKKGTDIWEQTLQKIEYKNAKSDFNSKIARFIFMNYIRLNLALDNKQQAEKYLNQLQENLIDIKLSSSEERELNQLESEIYKRN